MNQKSILLLLSRYNMGVITQDRLPKIFAIFGKIFLNFKIFFSSKNHFYKVDFQKKIFSKVLENFSKNFFENFFPKMLYFAYTIF